MMSAGKNLWLVLVVIACVSCGDDDKNGSDTNGDDLEQDLIQALLSAPISMITMVMVSQTSTTRVRKCPR